MPTPPTDAAAATLSRILRRFRLASGMSRAELADRADMTLNHYAALEIGTSSNGAPANPRLSTLRALAKALGRSLSDLMSGL